MWRLDSTCNFRSVECLWQMQHHKCALSVKMLPMVLLMCICDSKAVSPAHMETANPPRELLWFKWPGASFRTKPSSNATCHRGFSGHAGVVWMFYSGLSLEESSIFVARLKSQRSLRQNSNMWPLLICFHLWVIESSRGNPPQAKVELAVTQQVWGRWNPSFTNKWEWHECTRPVTAMLQRDGRCVINRNKLLDKWMNHFRGWLTLWMSHLVVRPAPWPGATVQTP